jgi:hypothetical protein
MNTLSTISAEFLFLFVNFVCFSLFAPEILLQLLSHCLLARLTPEMNAFSVLMAGAAQEHGRYAITFGEQAESQPGGTIIGSGVAEHGFSISELEAIAKRLGNDAAVVHRLDGVLPADQRKGNEAAVLVIKNGIDLVMKHDSSLPSSSVAVSDKQQSFANRMLKEQQGIAYDRHSFDRVRQRTCQKIARYNAVFADKAVPHSDDYRQSTVTAYASVPCLSKLRAALQSVFGDRAKELNAEGNCYYNGKRCGIGFHGDLERKIVICASLGATMVLRFCWRAPWSKAFCTKPVDLTLRHGDLYIMSEKASGNDWQDLSCYRVLHAAGASKYLECS